MSMPETCIVYLKMVQEKKEHWCKLRVLFIQNTNDRKAKAKQNRTTKKHLHARTVACCVWL